MSDVPDVTTTAPVPAEAGAGAELLAAWLTGAWVGAVVAAPELVQAAARPAISTIAATDRRLDMKTPLVDAIAVATCRLCYASDQLTGFCLGRGSTMIGQSARSSVDQSS